VNLEEELVRSWSELEQQGPPSLLFELYEQIIAGVSRLPEMLAAEDVKALELRTPLLSMGEYIAHRQMEEAARRFESALPRQRVPPRPGRRELPTRIAADDTYPVGGYSSIATRGSIESLLHSQLAYMEKDQGLRPDLFDIKFLRDELFYYSRDDNQFLRQHRNFVFVFQPDLSLARQKDPESPFQRLVLALGMMVAAVRKLAEWLGEDALHFTFVFSESDGTFPLADEFGLVQLMLRDAVANGMAAVERVEADSLRLRVRDESHRGRCHCLVVGVNPELVEVDEAIVAGMAVAAACPELRIPDEEPIAFAADEPFEAWTQALYELMGIWV
jgi:hypothetical protein